ncbi:MAG TPA: 3-dehydroquinate synthase [Candidatus Nanoarchaeia archaeon]|nr:3-dehydroquinate synthase [Candidatus Nanoarchaeia archaeon]
MKLHVRLSKTIDDSYDIIIGQNIQLAQAIAKGRIGNKYALITDSNVEKLIARQLQRALQKHTECHRFTFQAGEKRKNFATVESLLVKMHEAGIDRKSAVIACGGGVVGDVAGFVAATYMRGIPYIQVPTSLLAMVDSSIGGKVAVDLPTGKNMAGNFYQPKKVWIDANFLRTLPQKELVCGLAEIIKHGLIADQGLIRFIEKNLQKILRKDSTDILTLIQRSCIIKARIVERDEKESGPRKLLNYGHTIGHAVEKLSHFSLSHGDSISIGMAAEGKIAHHLGILSAADLQRQNHLLTNAGLPIELPFPLSKIMKELPKDKKVVNSELELVLLKRVGHAEFGVKVSAKEIEEALT